MTDLWNQNRRYILPVIYVIAAVLFILWIAPFVGDKKFSRHVQTLIQGILIGGIYGLVALGIVVINKASGVFNFAHGWMMVIGGMIFYSFFTIGDISINGAGLLAVCTVLMTAAATGYIRFSPRGLLRSLRGQETQRNWQPRNWAVIVLSIAILTFLMTVGGIELKWIHAIVGTICGSVFIGLVVERFAIRPLIGQPVITAVLMTLAVAEVMRGVTLVVWGSVELNLPLFVDPETQSKFKPLRLDQFKDMLDGTVIVRVELVIAFVLAIVAFLGFIAFFRYTSIGLAMRATAEDQQLAQSVGLRVRTILAATWGIAALLAAIGGILQGGAVGLSLNMNLLVLRVFPAILLGGLESIGGALIGGFIIGLVEQFGILLFPNQVGTDLAPYLVLMAVLVIRPDGLFGEKRIERI